MAEECRRQATLPLLLSHHHFQKIDKILR